MKIPFTLPRISMTWAIAVVLACLLTGGLSVFIFMPQEVSFDTISLTAVSPEEDAVPDEKEPEKKEADFQETAPPDPIAKTEPVEENSLEEEEQRVVSETPLTLPAKGDEGKKTEDVQTIEADVAQVEQPPMVMPYYNAAYIERKGDLNLPVKTSEGARPFDAYQGDFLLDPTKIHLTLVVSELGIDPELFEQIKSSFSKEVSCAFVATHRLSQDLNNEARQLGHETILMIPMESMDYPNSDPGPGTLLTGFDRTENQKRLEAHLSQFTGYIAVTPYMGNRFSRVMRDFQPILKEIEKRGLGYFEPRLVRSKTAQWKPKDMLYAKGSYDIERGSSVSHIQTVLERVKEDLSQKYPVILTVQADKVSLKEVQKWLPTVLNEDIVLAPLSAVIE